MGKCSAITQSGTKCKALPIRGEQYCRAHHPDYEEERRRHGARGGKRGGRGRPQGELADLKSEVHEVIEAVRSGELDKGIGAVVFQGYNTLLKAVSVGLDVKEQLDVLERMEKLEEALEQRRRGEGFGA